MSSAGRDGSPSRSSSAIVANTVRGCHLLKIDGYSRTKELLPLGSYTSSSTFRVGKYSWYIKYYPNSGFCNTSDSISLILVAEPPEFYDSEFKKAEFRFSLLDRAGKTVPAYIRTITAAMSILYPLNRRLPSAEMWSCYDFIKREELEGSEHLINDGFTVRCDIILMKTPCATDAPPPPAPVAVVDVAVPPPELQTHMADLLLSGEGADVTFQVGDESFPVHRCVLAARSTVFKAELFGTMKEKGKVHVDGIEAEAFKAMLGFIYTDAVPEFDELDKEIYMTQHLLVVADRYNLERLKLICENKLCKRIDVDTAATTLALAEQHHCFSLKEACMDFLNSPTNLKAVEATDGFDHLARSCPSVLRELIAKLVAL